MNNYIAIKTSCDHPDNDYAPDYLVLNMDEYLLEQLVTMSTQLKEMQSQARFKSIQSFAVRVDTNCMAEGLATNFYAEPVYEGPDLGYESYTGPDDIHKTRATDGLHAHVSESQVYFTAYLRGTRIEAESNRIPIEALYNMWETVTGEDYRVIKYKRTDFARPEGVTDHPLSDIGKRAWLAIVTTAEKIHKKSAQEHLWSGGCHAFCTPLHWQDRREKYHSESELIVLYDGGDLAEIFNPAYGNYEASGAMVTELEAAGVWAEAGRCVDSGIYELDAP